MKYGLLIFVFVFLGCSKDDPNIVTSSELKGKWIEMPVRDLRALYLYYTLYMFKIPMLGKNPVNI